MLREEPLLLLVVRRRRECQPEVPGAPRVQRESLERPVGPSCAPRRAFAHQPLSLMDARLAIVCAGTRILYRTLSERLGAPFRVAVARPDDKYSHARRTATRRSHRIIRLNARITKGATVTLRLRSRGALRERGVPWQMRQRWIIRHARKEYSDNESRIRRCQLCAV